MIQIKVRAATYDKTITFLFECKDDSWETIQKLAAEINEKLKDSYYFATIEVTRI